MENKTAVILKMIDKGKDIITISNLLGLKPNGFFKLLGQYPILEEIVKQKLNGNFRYHFKEDYKNSEDDELSMKEYIDIPINVISIDEVNRYNEYTRLILGVNIQLPKITYGEDLFKVANFVNDVFDFGDDDDDVSWNEKNFIYKGDWDISSIDWEVNSINGIPFDPISDTDDVSEEEFVNIIHDKI